MEDPKAQSRVRQELLYQGVFVNGKVQESLAVYMLCHSLSSEWRYRLDRLLLECCQKNRLAAIKIQGGIGADFSALYGQPVANYLQVPLEEKIGQMVKCLANGSPDCQVHDCSSTYVFSWQAWRDIDKPFSFSKKVLMPS